ncbi:oxidoreductase with FAD/NAD(P)-binding domain [Legionella wadsworthii]|uniref:Oxidoreductase with FAD/NAD(P)-binding domain n=1 Tax=Legionella wadsworthii TaxID=28088 RepID=A0A378LVR2_9GAMM|nr:UbiH/UbiF/VisC/COQ6 family ubiquinone biosynthesis hydroxylase [Legionella wadsworthii]STY31690.1 oxidoreductase with FAD/NAD(P)-binding domain [Legionella wadsworthii]
MNVQFNVLIIGGGIVGLTAALSMAERGYSVAVIDAESFNVQGKRSDTRVYAINYASQVLLQQLNVWQHLEKKRISPYNSMYVWDAESGAHIDFDSRYVGSPNLGTILEEVVLKKALLKQVATQSLISLFPESCVDQIYIEENGVKVCCDQQTWEGQLLMIADGANSPARQILKVPLNSWSYNQNAIVATVSVEKPHQQTAYQVFHADGPLAFLPLANEHHCSIVWSTDPANAKKLMSLADQDFNISLTKAFASKLGQVELVSKRQQFPLQMRHVQQYVGQRWLLLGDAAHTIHPLAGLGLNVGLADVCSWIQCLDASKGTFISKKALGAYQRERKYSVWQIIVLMEGFKRLFGNSFIPIVTLRGLGLNFCNGLTPIKRLFIQHAQGIHQ